MREFKDEPERQIVGIVGDVRDGGLITIRITRMYTPQAQVPDAVMPECPDHSNRLTIRTKVEPHSLSARIQEELRQVTGLPVSDIHTMDDVVSLSTSRQRLQHAAHDYICMRRAFLLAAVGIYGLMALLRGAATRRSESVSPWAPEAAGQEYGRTDGNDSDHN